MTTPISYISSIPFDPFIGRAQISQPGMIDIARASFVYVNVPGGYKARFIPGWDGATNISGNTELIHFNGTSAADPGPAYNISWMLASPGPTKKTRHPKLFGAGDFVITHALMANDNRWSNLTSGQTATYDSTNGTVSAGIIVRTSAGIP